MGCSLHGRAVLELINFQIKLTWPCIQQWHLNQAVLQLLLGTQSILPDHSCIKKDPSKILTEVMIRKLKGDLG